MNKKALVLRDIVFMVIIFSGIIAMATIFVSQMGSEYDNDDMVNSFDQYTIGNNSLKDSTDKWDEIAEDLSGKNGVIQMLEGSLKAIGVILLEVIKAPATFAAMLTSTFDIFGVEKELRDIASFILSGLLYGLIAFGIAKVFLRGGDI